MGSCARSWDYTVSGFRSYLKFAGQVLPLGASLLPPKLRIPVAWQRTFRSHGTYCNYLGHVKTACLVRGVSTQVLRCSMSGHVVLSPCCAKVFSHPALLRAKSTVKKYRGFKPRERMWIRRQIAPPFDSCCDASAQWLAQADAEENRGVARPGRSLQEVSCDIRSGMLFPASGPQRAAGRYNQQRLWSHSHLLRGISYSPAAEEAKEQDLGQPVVERMLLQCQSDYVSQAPGSLTQGRCQG